MHRFFDPVIRPLLEIVKPQSIVEIGAAEGRHTKKILSCCKDRGATLHCIDVKRQFEVEALQQEFPMLRFYEQPSVQALPTIGSMDMVLIDGDHNFYTVREELRIIAAKNGNGSPPMILLHDTSWPYGRRDAYERPEAIPETARKKYAKIGIDPDINQLKIGGFNDHVFHAEEYGNDGNGVLTAVEQFLVETDAAYLFTRIHGLHGLGVITPHARLDASKQLRQFLESCEASEPIAGVLMETERERISEQAQRSGLESAYRLLSTALTEARERSKQERETMTAALESERTVWRDRLREERDMFAEELSRERDRNEEAAERQREEHTWGTVLHTELERIKRSRSWRWTAPIRVMEAWIRSTIRSLPYYAFTIAGSAWKAVGSPFPGFMRRMRHELLGRLWPAHRTADWRLVTPEKVSLPDPADILQSMRTETLRFPHYDKPHISVVIPVHSHFEYTYACLRSIAHNTVLRYEVIVVDDGSTDRTQEMLGSLPNIRVIRQEESQGFIAACNAGAAIARGDYIVFLNNDTLVPPRWLGSLAETFQTHARVGLVGAKLIFPDGKLQEAGGVVWKDGSAANVGRGQDPRAPGFTFVRDVDYCSGACIMVPRALFQELGCFHKGYAPGYYEDTDLAFRIREAGYRVLYQPSCEVVHFGGVTAGTDLSQGMKRFQEINREKFKETWKDMLARHPAPGGLHDHRIRLRILVIDAEMPRPDRDSGSLRMDSLLSILKTEEAAVTFIPMNLANTNPYGDSLRRRGIRVLTHPHLSSIQAHLRAEGRSYDLIILSRLESASAYFDAVRSAAPRARIIFDTVDLHFLREEREGHIKQNAAILKRAKKHKKIEADLAERADAVLVVSEEEKIRLEAESPRARVFVLSNIHAIRPPETPFSQRRGILFLGSFRHPPNHDGIFWFVESVFPKVRTALPDAELMIIGEHVPDRLLTMRDQGIIALGHVENLHPYLETARLSVAPLRFGAGVKGKINMSMSAGLPVVATAIAAEGMHLVSGENVLLADTEERLAQAVVRLYSDEHLWNVLSQGSLQNVQEHFSTERAQAAVQEIFHALLPAANVAAAAASEPTPPVLIKTEQERPLLFFFGHHKCASSWMAKIMYAVSKHIGLKCGTFHNDREFRGTLEQTARASGDVLCYLNADRTYVQHLRNFRGIHLIRDPRDIIVSAYFSHLYTHPTENWPALEAHRAILRDLPKEQGLLLEMQFSNWVLRHMRNWNYRDPDILELKLREFTTVPTSFFIDAFTHLGLLSDQPCPVPYPGPTLTTVDLLRIIEMNNFSALAGGRARGIENLQSHYRKGTVGDWKNHFTEAHAAWFKENHGDLVTRLGFEQDDAWGVTPMQHALVNATSDVRLDVQ
ncbi:glycosyltransferase [Candidatus Peregrinibacteria bacterium]|nr:glycosyltransferase [Candidatus Peregrinibacteria bacterium]